jgi:hypothetical protein
VEILIFVSPSPQSQSFINSTNVNPMERSDFMV